jgi:tyrosine-protein kinase Etk/Wzc
VQGIVLIHRFLAEIRSSGQRVIAIVSVDEGDGKSTVAASLAQYAAAITHQKTALIDCDIHQHTLTKRFAPEAQHSFAHALEGAVQPGAVMVDPANCAFSICASPSEENPLGNTQMIMSPAMPKFVKAVAKDYDLVILDTSGIRNNVETRALVSMADIVIMVVDARSTTVEDVRSVKEIAPDLETKLAGVVLNHTA